jgi:hypothetical protein
MVHKASSLKRFNRVGGASPRRHPGFAHTHDIAPTRERRGS